MRSGCILLAFGVAGIVSCTSDALDVDVSDIDVTIQFERFEQQLSAANSAAEIGQVNRQLIEKGGALYAFYVADMLRSGSVDDDSIGTYLFHFVSDSIMQMVVADISEVFGDFKWEQEQCIDLFQHLRYHLPDAPIPKMIVTYNSAFNYGIVSTDDRIGIGLDMYLGPSNRIVKELGFPLYVKQKMQRQWLAVDVAHSWLTTHVMEKNGGATFLDQLVYYGKLRYLIDALLPTLPDHLKIRYTEEEYDWSLASESAIWQHILDMNWVYNTDVKLRVRFFRDAPKTVGIEGSPDRIGQFIGWQMVRQYMADNTAVTIEELLQETNTTKFLKTYHPNQ